ncbi:hypothetical protein ACNKHS_05480 [Shigella flexneri]
MPNSSSWVQRPNSGIPSIPGVFGGFVFQQILLSFFDTGQYRGFAGFIFIYTNPEVDFARAVVGTNRSARPRIGSAGAAVMFSNMTKFHCDYRSEIRYQGDGRFTKCQLLLMKAGGFSRRDIPLKE